MHELEDRGWVGCLAEIARLTEDQLDAQAMNWRLHVFTGGRGLPGAGAGTVAVLQVTHALGDGIRTSALAAMAVRPRGRRYAGVGAAAISRRQPAMARLRAARAHRQLVADTDTELVPPQADSCPALQSNARPDGVRSIRTVIRNRAQLPGSPVTVGVLAAVSTALADHLRELGDDPSLLGAEVPMAKAGVRRAHNHFGNVGVALHPELDVDQRAHASRRSWPGAVAGRRIRQWLRGAARSLQFLRRYCAGVYQFDPTVRSPTVIGNTVVSSVNRGPADLHFGERPSC